MGGFPEGGADVLTNGGQGNSRGGAWERLGGDDRVGYRLLRLHPRGVN